MPRNPNKLIKWDVPTKNLRLTVGYGGLQAFVCRANRDRFGDIIPQLNERSTMDRVDDSAKLRMLAAFIIGMDPAMVGQNVHAFAHAQPSPSEPFFLCFPDLPSDVCAIEWLVSNYTVDHLLDFVNHCIPFIPHQWWFLPMMWPGLLIPGEPAPLPEEVALPAPLNLNALPVIGGLPSTAEATSPEAASPEAASPAPFDFNAAPVFANLPANAEPEVASPEAALPEEVTFPASLNLDDAPVLAYLHTTHQLAGPTPMTPVQSPVSNDGLDINWDDAVSDVEDEPPVVTRPPKRSASTFEDNESDDDDEDAVNTSRPAQRRRTDGGAPAVNMDAMPPHADVNIAEIISPPSDDMDSNQFSSSADPESSDSE